VAIYESSSKEYLGNSPPASMGYIGQASGKGKHVNATQANRAKPEWCEIHEMSGCGECNGLADEIREAVGADQRMIIAAVSRKRANGDAPPIMGRARTGARGTDVNRRWEWK